MSHRSWLVALLVGIAMPGYAGPLTEVEITPDPVRNGSQVLTVRMTPGETCTYDSLVFDCVYHQEFVPRTSDNGKTLKVHEPEVFTVRRRDVKMVEELDVNISFKVPVDPARLKEMYGPNAFNPDVPVTISRIRISAMKNGAVAWWYEFEARGLHKPTATGAEESFEKEYSKP